ncbi:MAG: type II 3-dehydroquinate dehydratase [Dehalococcoidia bacterium]|nr:type II 3-dehydroquinate dehydratase [Dehalococcoidia bacterium]
MKILLINGPNLNMLGNRDKGLYGSYSLETIQDQVVAIGEKVGLEVECFQSNSEGDIIDFLQEKSAESSGVIINPGALTHYSIALRDALVDSNLPVVEVHLSNIYARESWRHISVIAPISLGQISGLGYRSYGLAMWFIADYLKEGT